MSFVICLLSHKTMFGLVAEALQAQIRGIDRARDSTPLEQSMRFQTPHLGFKVDALPPLEHGACGVQTPSAHWGS